MIRPAEIRTEKGCWLDHMFVLPEHIGRGIGSVLLARLRRRCRTNGIKEVMIPADLSAGRFYEKPGCGYLKDLPF